MKDVTVRGGAGVLTSANSFCDTELLVEEAEEKEYKEEDLWEEDAVEAEAEADSRRDSIFWTFSLISVWFEPSANFSISTAKFFNSAFVWAMQARKQLLESMLTGEIASQAENSSQLFWNTWIWDRAFIDWAWSMQERWKHNE